MNWECCRSRARSVSLPKLEITIRTCPPARHAMGVLPAHSGHRVPASRRGRPGRGALARGQAGGPAIRELKALVRGLCAHWEGDPRPRPYLVMSELLAPVPPSPRRPVCFTDGMSAVPKSDALRALYWREEILQVMFLAQGEGPGERGTWLLLERFLGMDARIGTAYLDRLVDEGSSPRERVGTWSQPRASTRAGASSRRSAPISPAQPTASEGRTAGATPLPTKPKRAWRSGPPTVTDEALGELEEPQGGREGTSCAPVCSCFPVKEAHGYGGSSRRLWLEGRSPADSIRRLEHSSKGVVRSWWVCRMPAQLAVPTC
jgi:hypothetical protein